ncbi:MAG: hypothetical protein IJ800_02240 [Clostridia bacterium]|nr:hypothetical protein [Clostridia bacterium]
MDNILNFFAENLKTYGAGIYEYEGRKFIGIKNPFSDNNLVITFDPDHFTMEFTYQAARFSYGDEQFALRVIEDYLNDKNVAVEIFLNGKSLFGGTRSSENCDFTDNAEFAEWYLAGRTDVAGNLTGFLENDGVEVKIFSWSGKFDRVYSPKK